MHLKTKASGSLSRVSQRQYQSIVEEEPQTVKLMPGIIHRVRFAPSSLAWQNRVGLQQSIGNQVLAQRSNATAARQRNGAEQGNLTAKMLAQNSLQSIVQRHPSAVTQEANSISVSNNRLQLEAQSIQRATENNTLENELDEAIAIVEEALAAFQPQVMMEEQVDQTVSEQEVGQQQAGLVALLEKLNALKGTEQVDEIAQVTAPILAAANGDLRAANQLQEQNQSQVKSGGDGTAPTIQRMAQAVAAPALVAVGPIGWGILAVGTLATLGLMAYQASRSSSRAIPRAMPRTRDRDRRNNTMRFQVQWNTNAGGPTFSQVVNAPSQTGVTTMQAVAALESVVAGVSPSSTKKSAQSAKAQQIAWVLSRPPAGIAVGGYSHPAYFRYKRYTDARVDVENVRGHNLRM